MFFTVSCSIRAFTASRFFERSAPVRICDVAEIHAFVTDAPPPPAFAEACARAQKAGKPIGILAPVEEDARRYLEMGFTYVAVGSDIGVLRNAVEQLRARFA